MKTGHWILLAGVAAAGLFAFKYRAKIKNLVAPDPTVTTLAGATWGAAQDVPGTVTGAVNGLTSSSDSSYDPTTASPAMNAALTGAGAGLDAGGVDA